MAVEIPTETTGQELGAEFVLLRDGGQALIRPYRPSDRSQIEALFSRLSPLSRELRFHTAAPRLSPALLDRVVAGHALVGQIGATVAAISSYYRLRDPGRAEMAISVDDAQHGRGLGTALFERLSRDAWAEGIHRFIALVLAKNQAMLALLHGLGFRTSRTLEHGVLEVTVDLTPDASYLQRADTRRHRAAVASLQALFEPRAIAIVGASRRRGAIGHEIVRNLAEGGFRGRIYPINPRAEEIAGLPAFASALALSEPIDLAIIATPASSALEVAGECLDAGARVLLVVSSGFAELGEDGRRLQQELTQLCHARGARLVGPHSMGILVNRPLGALNATPARRLPLPGRLAISSQLGTLGVAVIELGRRLGIGLAAFVSIGDKADVSSNDLLDRWEEDESVEQIALHAESYGDPRHFSRVVRRVAARKPVVAVGAGRSFERRQEGQDWLASVYQIDGVDAADLFRRLGVVPCETLEEAFESLLFLAHQPAPAGNRVAILTNAAELGLIAADACRSAGLQTPELAADACAALAALLPPRVQAANPVMLPVDAPPSHYSAALRALLADPGVDAALVLVVPPREIDPAEVAAALTAAADPRLQKPITACFDGQQGVSHALRGARAIPSYTFAEAAARALGRAAIYGAWLRRPAGDVPPLEGIDLEAARGIVEAALEQQQTVELERAQTRTLLHAYGVSVSPSAGVRPGGVVAECRAGIVSDRVFGPLLAFGLAGPVAEASGDVAFLTLPVTDLDVEELLESLRGGAILRGFRGGPTADLAAIRELLLRLCRLADDLPELTALDLSPVLVLQPGEGLAVLDARTRLTRS